MKNKTISTKSLHKKTLKELRLKKLEEKLKSNIRKRKKITPSNTLNNKILLPPSPNTDINSNPNPKKF